jgi:hypothetical protein
MGKGIIKSTMGGTTKPVRLTTTVTTDSGSASSDSQFDTMSAPGNLLTGVITDNSTGKDIQFEQFYGAELGLNTVGLKVTFNTIDVNGTIIANAVKPLEKGIVETLNSTNDGGTLKDRATGLRIPFYQAHCKETGLVPSTPGAKGSVVTYEKVIDPKTGEIVATCLEIRNSN